MKITTVTTSTNVVTINTDKYLKLLRSHFDIVQAKNGNDELQALAEAVTMKTYRVLEDRGDNDQSRLSIAKQLNDLYAYAADYTELLSSEIQSKIDEDEAKKSAESMDKQVAYLGGDV